MKNEEITININTKSWIKKIVTFIISTFTVFGHVKKVASFVGSVLFYAVFSGIIWWLSAYTHESDIIEACKNNQPFHLLHSDYIINHCITKDTK